MIKLLTARGADLYAHPYGGETPIHTAVEERKQESVRALVDYARSRRWNNYVNVGSSDNVTPLHIAAYLLDEPMIRLLLNLGASPNLPTSGGQTPIDMVRDSKRSELVDLMEKYR